MQLIEIKIDDIIIEVFKSAFTYRQFEIINYLFSLPKTPLIQSRIQNYLATVSLHDCYNKETIENVLRNINLDPSRNNNE